MIYQSARLYIKRRRCYRPISLQGDLIRLNVYCQHLSDVPTRQVLHIGWYVARRSVHELTVQHSSSTVISIHHYNRTICRGCRLLQSQFRLPTKVGEQPLPMILVAGGCGVAPIRDGKHSITKRQNLATNMDPCIFSWAFVIPSMKSTGTWWTLL